MQDFACLEINVYKKAPTEAKLKKGWFKKTKNKKQTFDLIMAFYSRTRTSPTNLWSILVLDSKMWVNALTATSVALGMHILKQ